VKYKRIAFTFDERSLRTIEQLRAEGHRFYMVVCKEGTTLLIPIPRQQRCVGCGTIVHPIRQGDQRQEKQ
jgi:hypothetical protein